SSDTETDSDPDPDFASPLTFSDYLKVENATLSSAGGSPNPDGKAGLGKRLPFRTPCRLVEGPARQWARLAL
ncbi:MAG: hypothetical protein QM518_03805, partial [Verrucomicrobiota bacterium]|nr:hypothetical protein [Verrucomicrobiota bacterium]